jgi:polyferredoxin
MMIGEKSDRKAQRAFRAVRLAFLALFLVVSTVFGIMHQFLPGTKPVSVDALDPFGGIESAITVITTGQLVAKIAWSSFILLLATLIVALAFRRVFCGKICAFGALQELFGRLGKRVFRKRFTVPKVVDRSARFLKYAVLAVVVALTAITGTLVIRPYDPWAAYHHILSAELITGFWVGLILLVVSLVGSLFYDRFFCKYLCPMGGFLGLINRIGWFRVKRVEATCTHCMACDKACPMNIKVESLAQVQSSECINCGLCVNACPVKDTLVIEGPRKGRISSGAVLAITLVVFVAVVGTATALGAFQWTQATLEERTQAAATFNPDDIKGSDTFAAVSSLTGIPKEEFVKRFSLAEDDFDKPIKDAAHREGAGFDTTDVREFVKEKLGK